MQSAVPRKTPLLDAIYAHAGGLLSPANDKGLLATDESDGMPFLAIWTLMRISSGPMGIDQEGLTPCNFCTRRHSPYGCDHLMEFLEVYNSYGLTTDSVRFFLTFNFPDTKAVDLL